MGVRATKGVNDLASQYPEVAAEWDYERNMCGPDEVCCMSSKKRWFICSEGHSYEAVVHSRTKSGSGCPYCSGRVPIVGVNDFESCFPDIAKEWHPTLNGSLLPNGVTKRSGAKVWWLGACGHEWVQRVADRAAGQGCPECARYRHSSYPEKAIIYYVRKLYPDAQENSDCGTPELGGQNVDVFIPSIMTGIEYDGDRWHADYARDAKKDKICSDAGIRLIRIREPKCPEYDHRDSVFVYRRDCHSHASLDDAIVEVLSLLGQAPEWRVDTKRDNHEIISLMRLKERADSFPAQHPNLIDEWHPTKNGDISPWTVSAGSGLRVWWICPEGHEYQTAVCTRTRGCGCPICANELRVRAHETVMPGESLLDVRPTLAREWHPTKNGDLTPSEVHPYTRRVVWWLCPTCGAEYRSSPQNRTDGTVAGCRSCRLKALKSKPKKGRSIAEALPKIASAWHPAKNGELTPSDVSICSAKEIWLVCPSCGTEYSVLLANKHGRDIPTCARCSRSNASRMYSVGLKTVAASGQSVLDA